MRYAILGFPKCGTISTQKWYSDKGYDCTKPEWPIFWSIDKVKKFLGDRIPVIVTREKSEALWSFYEYFGYRGQIPFKDFLNLRIRATNFLNYTPLEMFDYDRWINNLKELNPIIHKLEDLQKLDDYPHENLTMRKTSIPQEEKDLV